MKFIFATITAFLLLSFAFGQTTATTADDKINAEINQVFKDAETDFAPIRGDVANRTSDEIIYKTTKNYFESARIVTTLKFYSDARIDELMLSGSGKDAQSVFDLVEFRLTLKSTTKSSGNSTEYFVGTTRIAQLMKQGDKLFMWFYSNRSAWHTVNEPYDFFGFFDKKSEILNKEHMEELDRFVKEMDKNANNNYEAFVKKCNEFYEKEEYPKTIEACTEAIKLKGDDPALYQIRGLSYFFTPDKPKTGLDALTSIGSANKYAAIADLTKCTQLAPTKPECFYALGYVQLKTLNKDELDKSAKSFSEAIRLKSTEDDVYFQRAEAYREYYSRDEFFGNKDKQIRQRKELAIADYTKDIELRPTAIESRMGRGLVYLDLEKYALSVADFTKALDILNASGKQNPDYRKGILENRAQAYRNLGKNKEACQDLKAIGEECN